MPPNSRFLITTLNTWEMLWGKFIHVITDIPCYLMLHLQAKPSIYEPRWLEHRGKWSWRDPHISRKPYWVVHQEETGDVLSHTFRLDTLIGAYIINYYFTARVAGQRSPSQSPTFKQKGKIPLLKQKFSEPWSWSIENPDRWIQKWNEPWT